jgi:peptide/nickel transport system permease protein
MGLRDPLAQSAPDLLKPALSPSPDGGIYWLGTDDKGRDILSRLFHGSRLVLFWSGFATIIAYLVGMLMGVAAGYRGGWWDEIISFLGNVFLAFPQMVLYIVILSQLGPDSPMGQWLGSHGFGSTWIKGLTIVLAVMFATAPQVARIVRGLVLDLKTRDYVAAAEVRGETPFFIMIVELLPNARGPLIVDACLRLGYVTIAIAALGFLGLGLPPPDPDWGKMISEVRGYGALASNAMIWPALAISSLVLGLNLLADGLREISLRD